jgi:hypothetical protein
MFTEPLPGNASQYFTEVVIRHSTLNGFYKYKCGSQSVPMIDVLRNKLQADNLF